MLTQIFTPQECANCKLCCNFHRSSAWETPALSPEQVFLLQEMCVPLTQRNDGTVSFYLHFSTEDENEVANCPMLDTCKGCTLDREQRPFECRIWPLRIMKQHGKLVIGIYKACPALSEKKFNLLKDYALTELLPSILDYARCFPKAVREYDKAYQIIWIS